MGYIMGYQIYLNHRPNRGQWGGPNLPYGPVNGGVVRVNRGQ